MASSAQAQLTHERTARYQEPDYDSAPNNTHHRSEIRANDSSVARGDVKPYKLNNQHQRHRQ
jgi:hypothetical protein